MYYSVQTKESMKYYSTLLFVSWNAVALMNIDRTQAANDEGNPEWSYIDTQDNGPEKWAEIGYPDCGGDMQSPILLDTYAYEQTDEVKMIKFEQYDKEIKGLRLENSGTAVLVKLPESMEDDDRPYIENAGVDSKCFLKEFRFHFGENMRDGNEHNATNEQGDNVFREMEVQALHECPEEQEKGNTGLVALAIKLSNYFLATNQTGYEHIFNNVHKIMYAGTTTTIDDPINLYNLYPIVLGVFMRYTGSLTYPPCTEGVIWNVYLTTFWIDKTQVAEIRKLYRTPEGDENPQTLYGNIRPVQETNDREVVFVLTDRFTSAKLD